MRRGEREKERERGKRERERKEREREEREREREREIRFHLFSKEATIRLPLVYSGNYLVYTA